MPQTSGESRLLEQVSLEADLESLIAMDRHRKPHRASGLAVVSYGDFDDSSGLIRGLHVD